MDTVEQYLIMLLINILVSIAGGAIGATVYNKFIRDKLHKQ
jgi:hypothetical protein